jgi:hypothetical protein
MPRLLRMTLVLLLTASITTTAVMASPLSGVQFRRSDITAPFPRNVVAQAWRFLYELWFKNGSDVDPDGVWAKNGSHVDPSGNPLPPADSTTTGDNGAQGDPNGLH